MPELEKPLWLVGIYSVPKAHTQGLEKSLVIFIEYLSALDGI